ncbi:MAG: hypothetical protein LBM18_02395 [Oscillospiraceae bacterium]|jgi:hypothetical protein|nr:hypothetical protein [Oscillospiraceae bacterium]
MEKLIISPSFSMDDIRRIRSYEDRQCRNMTAQELAKHIQEGAREGHRILAELRQSQLG